MSHDESTAAAIIISLRSRGLDRPEDRGRLAVDALVAQARAALDDVLVHGDVDQLFTAHWAVIRAVSVAMSHGLSTPTDRPPA